MQFIKYDFAHAQFMILSMRQVKLARAWVWNLQMHDKTMNVLRYFHDYVSKISLIIPVYFPHLHGYRGFIMCVTGLPVCEDPVLRYTESKKRRIVVGYWVFWFLIYFLTDFFATWCRKLLEKELKTTNRGFNASQMD